MRTHRLLATARRQVAIPFEDIEDGFRVIREAFVDDVEPLIDQGDGGTYAAAILVAVGHEELSRIRCGRSHRGADSFTKTLQSTPKGVSIQVYRPTGRPQYATATAT